MKKNMKNLFNFLKQKEIKFPSFLFNFFRTASIYIILSLIMIYYIINENMFLFIAVSVTSGILSYTLSDLIKYFNNKYISLLQSFMLNIFIILIVTIIYIILINLDYLSFFNIIHLDGKDVEELTKEVSNNISNNKFNVELKKLLTIKKFIILQ
jgi:hypothetical protein